MSGNKISHSKLSDHLTFHKFIILSKNISFSLDFNIYFCHAMKKLLRLPSHSRCAGALHLHRNVVFLSWRRWWYTLFIPLKIIYYVRVCVTFWVWWSDCSSGSCAKYLLRGKLVPLHTMTACRRKRAYLHSFSASELNGHVWGTSRTWTESGACCGGGLVSLTVGLRVSG